MTAGVTSDDEGEAAVNRVMVQQAKRTIVVADSVKLGRVGFARICELTDVAGVLTDRARRPRRWRPSEPGSRGAAGVTENTVDRQQSAHTFEAHGKEVVRENE